LVYEVDSVVMIDDKHPDDLSSNPKVGIVIYEKFRVQIWEKKQFQWKKSLNERGEKLQKREKKSDALVGRVWTFHILQTSE
jgi:hypothetical protein